MPITSQMMSRVHVSSGKLDIRPKENQLRRIGTSGTIGVLKGRCRSGRRPARLHTPAHTMTNASNVPMLTNSPRMPIGIRAAKMATTAHRRSPRSRGAESWMHSASPLRQQSVTRHREEYARLAEKHHQHDATQSGDFRLASPGHCSHGFRGVDSTATGSATFRAV